MNKTFRTRKLVTTLMIPALLVVSFLLLSYTLSIANPEEVSFESAIVWRGDDLGDYKFNKDLFSSQGTYEISLPHIIDGNSIDSITAGWEFTGEVSLQVSCDNGLHYASVVNGVPLTSGFVSGNRLRWKATVGRDSELREVTIVYSDTQGLIGSFGKVELSGFSFRKPVYITNPSEEELFNYQLNVKVATSKSIKGHDVHCEGRVTPNFTGIRFTAADGETLLPYFREGVNSGLASFWVRIPQLGASGGKIYIYYGNNLAEDLSSGEEVFDFFDDFEGLSLDSEKWDSFVELDGDLDSTGFSLKLDSAKILSKDYQIKDGIIEYRAKSESGYETRLIVRSEGTSEDRTQIAYSSTYEDAQHCIAIGNIVKANDDKAILANTEYNYRVIAEGEDLTFERYDTGFEVKEASITFKDEGGLTTGFIGLEIGEGNVGYYDWVRVRKYVADAPEINPLVIHEEEINLPVFTNAVVAENGDLALLDGYTEGSYVSKGISSSFPIRIIIPTLSASTSGVAIDVSADKGETYKLDCVSDRYYYASKGDFEEGAALRCRLRLSAIDASVQKLGLNYEPGDIVLISPNGGEKWANGVTKEIMWTASQYESDYPIKLEYSLDKGKTYKSITKETENTGSYLWKVPTDIVSTKVRVKISDGHDNLISDASDKDFSIIEYVPVEAKDITEDLLTEEEIQEEWSDLAGFLAAASEDPTAEPYELLIKIGDNYASDPEEDLMASYKAGDIILVKPAGHKWSETEKNSYLIIRVDLPKEKAEEIVSPRKIYTGRRDDAGRPIMKTVKRRGYKVDLKKFGLGKEKTMSVAGVHRFLKGKVLSADIMKRK